MKNLYIIRELNQDGDAEFEYYFKHSKNRLQVYKNLIILDCAPHYNAWCEVHNYQVNGDSWAEYLQLVPPAQNKYIFLNGKVTADDIRYKYFSYEATIKKEKENEKLNQKRRNINS